MHSKNKSYMKRIFTILMALMILGFTQCKPTPDGGEENNYETNKVRISCSIPINKGSRSDFTDLFEEGVINWGDGRECVYLAIPGDVPKIIELEGYCDGYKPTVEFIAYVDEHLLTAGESYDIWYFGHSQQLDEPYVSLVNGNKIEGSIAKQTGRLEDLGYSHIASTTVKAVMENGEVKLPLVGTLKNRMAIALLDLSGVNKLSGHAVNTDYILEYNAETCKYEFCIVEDVNATINVENKTGISYIALLPNNNNKVVLNSCIYGYDGEYTFYNGIRENNIYYKIDGNGNMTSLSWQVDFTQHQCVDLGLPSGLKWGASNVGASLPEEYGNYYRWGEIKIYNSYMSYKFPNVYNISGKLEYDVATADWGGNWRMPKKDEFEELIENCTFKNTTHNGVNGYSVTSKINGSCIFLPAAGYYNSTNNVAICNNAGIYGYYWTSEITSNAYDQGAYGQIPYFFYEGRSITNNKIVGIYKDCGLSIRPVIK